MKFAHIADIHLGAFREKELKELNFLAFKMAVDKCIDEGVDFVILAGDIFHNPVPDMDIVNRAVRELMRLKEYGIEIYAIYGSHDFSAGSPSLLDVLSTAKTFTKITRVDSASGEKLRLRYIEDKKTGVKIFGLSGLSGGLDTKYFEILDREFLEKIPGEKIFVFHTGIAELIPKGIKDRNLIPLSYLPKNFNYYAGGHIHAKIEQEYNGSYIVYPGPLFGATYTDLEYEGERGFYIVEDYVPRFVPIKVCDFERASFKADGKSASELYEELREFAEKDHSDKVVLIKIHGELDSGKPSDVRIGEIREIAMKSARVVLINRYALRARSVETKTVVREGSVEEIENSVLKEIAVKPQRGITLNFVQAVLDTLRMEKGERTKKEHEEIVQREFWRTVKDYVERGPLPEKEKKSVIVKKQSSILDFLGGR